MTSQIIPVEPFDFVVFGGTGDLSERKLLPALYQRQKDGQFTEPTRILAASRSAVSDDGYRDFAARAIREHVKAEEIDEGELKRFLDRLSYIQVDAKGGDGFERLRAATRDSSAVRVFYLAVAPALFGDIAGHLSGHGLAGGGARIVVEKPIGRDRTSARALNDAIGRAASWLMLFMVLAAVTVAVLRYVFSIGFVWMQESYLWMHGALIMLGAAYTLRHGGHVRVDVFYGRMTPRRRALIDMAGVLLFLLPLVSVVFYISLPYVAESWQKRESSFQAGGMPGVYLLKTLIPVFCVLTALQGLAMLARAWLVLRAPQEPQEPQDG